MNPSEQQFLDALAQLGGSAGHGALRQKLGWNQPTYDQIQTTQKDQGKILPGRGRLAEATQQTPDLFGVSGAEPAGKSRPVSPATPKESGHQPKAAPSTSSATIGFEAKLWLTADKLRNNMDAAEYKHVVLGLIFLKYISDTFRRDLRTDYPRN